MGLDEPTAVPYCEKANTLLFEYPGNFIEQYLIFYHVLISVVTDDDIEAAIFIIKT